MYKRQAEHLPGGEWLYASVYCAAERQDELIATELPSLLHSLPPEGIDRWFFLRYRDQEQPQLRLRLHGDPGVLTAQGLPRLNEWVAGLRASGLARRLILDTYDPEAERYGGAEAIDAAERAFHADSLAVLEQLRLLDTGRLTVDPLLLAAANYVDLIRAFWPDDAGSPTPDGEPQWVRWLLGSYAKHGASAAYRVFRKRRRDAVALIDPYGDWASLRERPGGEAVLAAFARRAPAVAGRRGVRARPAPPVAAVGAAAADPELAVPYASQPADRHRPRRRAGHVRHRARRRPGPPRPPEAQRMNPVSTQRPADEAAEADGPRGSAEASKAGRAAEAADRGASGGPQADDPPRADRATAARAASVVAELAGRLADPDAVVAVATAEGNVDRPPGRDPVHPWGGVTLAEGHPGVALLFAELAQDDPRHRAHAHAHLALAARALSANHGAGLYVGAPSLALAACAARRGPGDYATLLDRLDSRIEARVRQLLAAEDERLAARRAGASMDVYDLILGLAGIGRYLLLRADRHRDALTDTLAYLVRLTEPVRHLGHTVPG
ncbi:hypothetical protein ADK38_20870, partial [Streptomyces varsoviensis]